MKIDKQINLDKKEIRQMEQFELRDTLGNFQLQRIRVEGPQEKIALCIKSLQFIDSRLSVQQISEDSVMIKFSKKVYKMAILNRTGSVEQIQIFCQRSQKQASPSSPVLSSQSPINVYSIEQLQAMLNTNWHSSESSSEEGEGAPCESSQDHQSIQENSHLPAVLQPGYSIFSTDNDEKLLAQLCALILNNKWQRSQLLDYILSKESSQRPRYYNILMHYDRELTIAFSYTSQETLDNQ